MGVFGNRDPDSMVGTRIAPATEVEGDSGDAAFGKPVPFYRRQAGYDHCKAMGMTDRSEIMDCVNGMAEKIARDEPMMAMDHGYRFLDVTGVYRLMAVLCCAEKPRVRVRARSRRA